MGTMERSLRRSAPPMEELLREVVDSAEGEVRSVLCRLSLNSLESAPFSAQWKRMTRNITLQLNEAERRALERPGTVLGRCGVEEQCACLGESERELRRFARDRELSLAEKRRVWYTLSLSAALLTVVELI